MVRDKGFTIVETIMVLVVIAVVAAVAWLAYTNFYATENTMPADTSSESSNTQVIVEDEKDLDSALSELDELDITDSDSGQLDEAAGKF